MGLLSTGWSEQQRGGALASTGRERGGGREVGGVDNDYKYQCSGIVTIVYLDLMSVEESHCLGPPAECN